MNTAITLTSKQGDTYATIAPVTDITWVLYAHDTFEVGDRFSVGTITVDEEGTYTFTYDLHGAEDDGSLTPVTGSDLVRLANRIISIW